MVADTYNITRWGLCPQPQNASGQATFTNASTNVSLYNASDYNAVSAGDFIICEVSSADSLYAAYRISSKGGGTTVVVDDAFAGTNGAYTVWLCYGSFGAKPRTLGDVKSVRKTLRIQSDGVGMFGLRFNNRLEFDTDGTMLEMEITGNFVDAGATYHSGDNFYNIERWAMYGGRMNSNAIFVWTDSEQYGGAPRAYPVIITSFEQQVEVAIKSSSAYILPYKLTMSGRMPSA